MQTLNTEFYNVREESDIDLFVLFLAGLRNLSRQVENNCSGPDQRLQANITHRIITIPESSMPPWHENPWAEGVQGQGFCLVI